MPDDTPSDDATPVAEPREDVDDGPPYACGHCGREFYRESYLALHRGQEHAAVLTPAERAAFEDARDAEVEELRLFRLKAVAALVLIYFGFLMLYAFSL